MRVPGAGHRPDQGVQIVPVLPPAKGVLESGIGCPSALLQHAANGLPFSIGGDGNGDPTVVALAGIAAVRRHNCVLVAQARVGAPVRREIHQDLWGGRTGGLGLGDVHELALPGAQPVHQGGHDREYGVLAGGVVGIGNLGHHRPTANIAGLICQTRRSLRGRSGGPVVVPRAVEPIAGGGHHDDVRFYLP